jgi:rare lipoprotein A
MRRIFLFVAAVLFAAACIHAPEAERAAPASPGTAAHVYQAVGFASWYGPGFAGRKTASGERFDPHEMTCAHRTLPFGTRLKVTDLASGASVIVRVNDRGPYARRRVIDLSQEAARRLGMLDRGTVRVRLEAVPNL